MCRFGFGLVLSELQVISQSLSVSGEWSVERGNTLTIHHSPLTKGICEMASSYLLLSLLQKP